MSNVKFPLKFFLFHSIFDMSVCGSCALNIDSSIEVIHCYGMCGRNYHLSCLAIENNAYKKAVIEYLDKISNLHWYCNECKLITNGLICSVKDCVRVLGDTKSVNSGGSSTSTTSTGANLQENVQEMREASGALSQTVADVIVTPVDYKRKLEVADFVNCQPRKRLIVAQSNVPSANASTAEHSVQSQIPPILSILKSAFPVAMRPGNDTKALFVSGLDKNTTDSDVIAHLREKGLDNMVNFPVNVRCEKLTGKWKQPTKVTYASFKIVVPAENYDIVADSKLWPEGTVIREFSNGRPSAPRKAESKIPRKINQTSKNESARGNSKKKPHQKPKGDVNQQQPQSEPDMQWIQVPIHRPRNRYQPMPMAMPMFDPWSRPMY